MPSLIIELHGQRQAGMITGRVLIGRWPENSVVVDDKAVSRIHAWVGAQDGHYYIADAGSRTGTYVNGALLHERQPLYDGDQIRIGPVLLHYQSASSPPDDAAEIDLTPRSAAELSGSHGVFMDCACGAPLWLPNGFKGVGQCRYCGRRVTQGIEPSTKPPAAHPAPGAPAIEADKAATLPRSAKRADRTEAEGDDFDALIEDAIATTAPPAPKPRELAGARAVATVSPKAPRSAAPPAPARRFTPVAAPPPAQAPASPSAAGTVKKAKDQICGICHTAVTVFDEVSTCPSCGLDFHADCWNENRGCSAYGCPQVGALDKKE